MWLDELVSGAYLFVSAIYALFVVFFIGFPAERKLYRKKYLLTKGHCTSILIWIFSHLSTQQVCCSPRPLRLSLLGP